MNDPSRTGARPGLPVASTPAGWSALLADDAALAAGVREILRRHGLGSAPVTRYDSGSLPVYAVGERHVLKLFPPHEAEHAAVEARTLAFVHGALPLPTPEVIATVTQDGWHGLLMSQLRGRRLVEAWPELLPRERDRAADDLGHALAALHRLDTAPLAGLPPQWDGFVLAQRASAVERQRARGLAEPWLAQIDRFLDRFLDRYLDPRLPAAIASPALLHTEVMREHLMVVPGPDGWRLNGLFDFEPAMLGDPLYEFASVGLFVSCGDARWLRRTLRAYGFATRALDDTLSCRFMAHALLHRYSNLRWYLERLPANGATTLEQLAARWWALADDA